MDHLNFIKMLKAITLIAILSFASCNQVDVHFSAFMKFVNTHAKVYETLHEFNLRFQIFKSNLDFVEDLETFSPFMDLTKEEFASKYLTKIDFSEFDMTRSSLPKHSVSLLQDLPDSVNWVDKGIVAPVKNLG